VQKYAKHLLTAWGFANWIAKAYFCQSRLNQRSIPSTHLPKKGQPETDRKSTDRQQIRDIKQVQSNREKKTKARQLQYAELFLRTRTVKKNERVSKVVDTHI